MIELNKKEVILWQAPFEMLYLQNDIPMDVEYLILTNQNLRIECIEKTPPFKREIKRITISLAELLNAITFKKQEDMQWKLSIETEKTTYCFYVHSDEVDVEEEYEAFTEKVRRAIERK